MQPLRLYTSAQADPKVMNLALDLTHLGHRVQLLPLSQLPRPDARRRQRLGVERRVLRSALALAGCYLSLYRAGTWQPDAAAEDALAVDQEALQARLAEIDGVLGAEKGGPDNG
ncbi:hypothetical protein [Hymenobacter sp.]|uniref:hypothetical protein n=1 Tax=Hymenobacter sp. TaxID=1898978 RepID=UPI00286BE1EA|nr:hypothetical protein [Hymenobacter sp.]